MDFLELVPVPPKDTFNVRLTSPGSRHMLDLLGHPVKGGTYRPDGECTTPNNPSFTPLLVTRSVGPFRVTGLRPAVQSLQDVLLRVRNELPELHALLGSAGMLLGRGVSGGGCDALRGIEVAVGNVEGGGRDLTRRRVAWPS
ncbi:MAG: hypothetical protein MUF00_15980 [Gemmatimonadaceae bacterium]|jgi:hypothetical protein|nr:hypothetical protein [Gemmatimonadaceae bacterium]